MSCAHRFVGAGGSSVVVSHPSIYGLVLRLKREDAVVTPSRYRQFLLDVIVPILGPDLIDIGQLVNLCPIPIFLSKFGVFDLLMDCNTRLIPSLYVNNLVKSVFLLVVIRHYFDVISGTTHQQFLA